VYGNVFILKLYRRLEEGISVDIEMVRYLTEKARFPHTPGFAGAIEYRQGAKEATALCMLQNYVPNQGDAWMYTRQNINTYFDNILAQKPAVQELQDVLNLSLLDIAAGTLPPAFIELAGDVYLDMIGLLGKRTGAMHLALARPTSDPAFRAERFTTLYQRALYQAMRVEVRRSLQLLAKQLAKLTGEVQNDARAVLDMENTLLAQLKMLTQKKLSAAKIRVHGDYHLGQVIFTGNDFMIIDFEGEPARALSERQLKRSPLRDVVGMMRSFHYAVYSLYFERRREEISDWAGLQDWLEIWFHYVSGRFLQAYLETVKGNGLLPEDAADINLLLNAYQIEKSLYELNYELNNRPDWLLIPIKGILQLVHKLKTG
jgi:maltose alpha-D-glucosyltransferase/alpha-amylase